MMKPPDALSIGEVAASFGWSTRFVEALARAEQIPSLEINGKLTFRREDIIDWLNQKIQTLDAARLVELERKMESELAIAHPRSGDSLDIRNHLAVESIALDEAITGKREILTRLVDLAVAGGRVLDRTHLLASVIEREAILSTGLPGGVAICHPRRPIPSAINDTVLAFLRTREPVAFGSEYGPTQMFLLLAAPDERSHLHGIARLSRILRTSVLEELANPELTAKPAEVLKLLTR